MAKLDTATRPRKRRSAIVLLALFGLGGLAGCSVSGTKKSYLLAEQLWTDEKYAAAVAEFEKVAAKDPNGKLGLMALYRAATTEAYFLSEYGDAIVKLRAFADASQDSAAVWEAQKQIGELLFSKTEQYDQAIVHYRSLLKLKADAPEAPEFLFRVGKSHFFLWQFAEAIHVYTEVMKRFAGSFWAEKAMYEIGVTYFTRGEQRPGEGGRGVEAYQDAMDAFESFLKRHPTSTMVPLARFGIASCLEEMDQLDAAYHAYEALKGSYPSPNVIEIKLIRIRERKAQRSR
ncbi:MAG: tetratricopeptide repeat protein [Oligoflexia bacterium]|nr:tetratricopeptide repeat protein [Oligoflexia bacterium]